MQLTQKETSLLKDLKTQENLCAEKYEKYSAEALDPQLKTLFSGIADTERNHLSMLEQIEGGSAPATAGGSHTQPGFSAAYSVADTDAKKEDRRREIELIRSDKKELIASLFAPKGFAEANRKRLRGRIEQLQELIS